MKRLSLLFAMLILLCGLATPVMAAQDTKPIHISGRTYYDPAAMRFLYYVDSASSQAIRSNVADGMITEQAVSVKADAGVAMEVYLNGERLARDSNGTYTTPGEYVVMYAGGTISQRVFTFTIVPELCNYVASYALPSGFEFTEVSLNGEAVTFDKTYIRLTEEGKYSIHYRCLKTNISYQLQMQTDFTGPTLSLEEVKGGKARGPVDISEAKYAAAVNIYHDGERIARKDVLTESGEYVIELADAAGNKTVYSFTILVYFDGNSWVFFLMVFFACVGTVAYLLHSRKHLRVR